MRNGEVTPHFFVFPRLKAASAQVVEPSRLKAASAQVMEPSRFHRRGVAHALPKEGGEIPSLLACVYGCLESSERVFFLFLFFIFFPLFCFYFIFIFIFNFFLIFFLPATYYEMWCSVTVC